MPSSSGGSGSSGIPLLAWLAMGGGQAVLSELDANATRNQQDKLTAQQLAAQKEARDQATALQESLANPFRQQAAQISTASALDETANGRYTPVHLTPPPGMAKYVPQMSGGYSYEKSPALTNAAGAAERDVLAGHTAPTMTNPANYGKTAVLSLDANGNPVPSTASYDAAAGGPKSVADFEASYARRGGGGSPVRGAVSGALTGASIGSMVPGLGTAVGAGIGAAYGGIKGLATRHAKTANTDFGVDDARDAIGKAVQYYQGRQASPQEIDQLLQSQGWKPGDRWVGQTGLTGLLTHIAGR